MKVPEISVVIPVYNGAAFLRETLDSVFRQSMQDFEVVVVDDGSTDSTVAMASSVSDPRLRVLRVENRGTAASRNRGSAAARGRFLAFLDHDDLWTEHKLEEQHRALVENPDAAVAYGWIDFVDELSRFMRPGCHQSPTGDMRIALLKKNFVECGSNLLIRREVLEAVGGFDVDADPIDDFDLLLKLAVRGFRFVGVPRVHVLYRQHRRGMSRNVHAVERGYFYALRHLDEQPEEIRKLRSNSTKRLFVFMTWKTLQWPSSRKDVASAAQFLRRAIETAPEGLEWRVRLGYAIKLAIGFVSPSLLTWATEHRAALRRFIRALRNR